MCSRRVSVRGPGEAVVWSCESEASVVLRLQGVRDAKALRFLSKGAADAEVNQPKGKKCAGSHKTRSMKSFMPFDFGHAPGCV